MKHIVAYYRDNFLFIQVQLGHFIENRDFMPEVKECCHQVVNAAIAIYYKMCNAMLPTPNKSHYTFNLRDMSAVIKGVLQVLSAKVFSVFKHIFVSVIYSVFLSRFNFVVL